MSTPAPQILGLGNPLLDITVTIDPKFLEKYELDANTQYMADAKTLPLFGELEKMADKKMIPGGSSQNTIRAAQWALNVPGITAFAGCVGNDEFGRAQRDILKKEGVTCAYDCTTAQPTGTCAALITGKNRCLVANIGAANCFSAGHLYKEDITPLLKAAKIYYFESFFVTVSMEALLIAAHNALANDEKYFAMNLSAKWVIDGCLRNLLELLPFADFVFCNEDEARCFATRMQWAEKEDVQKIAQAIALLPKLNPAKQRVVVITQGSEPVVLATGRFNVDCDGKEIADAAAIRPMGGASFCGCLDKIPSLDKRVCVKTFPVALIPKEEMKDTNGCGDSFVGGFLAAFIKGRSLEQCVESGNRMAQIIARADGCVFPEKHDFEL